MSSAANIWRCGLDGAALAVHACRWEPTPCLPAARARLSCKTRFVVLLCLRPVGVLASVNPRSLVTSALNVSCLPWEMCLLSVIDKAEADLFLLPVVVVDTLPTERRRVTVSKDAARRFCELRQGHRSSANWTLRARNSRTWQLGSPAKAQPRRLGRFRFQACSGMANKDLHEKNKQKPTKAHPQVTRLRSRGPPPHRPHHRHTTPHHTTPILPTWWCDESLMLRKVTVHSKPVFGRAQCVVVGRFFFSKSERQRCVFALFFH